MQGSRHLRGKSNGTDHVARLALRRADAAQGGAVARNVFSFANAYINYATGSDKNNGLTPSTAFKTNAGFAAAVGVYGLITAPGSAARLAIVNYEGEMPPDPLVLQATLDANVSLQFKGTALVTTAASGTFSAVVDYTHGSNTLGSVTDTSQTWASHINARLTWTSGGAAGAHAWVAKDLGSGVARTSKCMKLRSPTTTFTIPAYQVPNTGTYTIDALPSLVVGLLDVWPNTAGPNTRGVVDFLDLDLAEDGGGLTYPNPSGGVTFLLSACSCEWQVLIATSIEANITCFPNGLEVTTAVQFQAYGVLATTLFAFIYGANALIDGYSLIEGCGLVCGGGAYVGLGQVASENAVGNFANASGDGFISTYPAVGAGAIVGTGGTYSPFTGSILGAGNAGVGWRVGRGNTDRADSLPLVTGTDGDFNLDAAGTARSFNETTAIYTVTAITCSWANLGLAVTSSGFGGGAHNPGSSTNFIGPAA